VLESALEEEMTEHLGYDKHHPPAESSPGMSVPGVAAVATLHGVLVFSRRAPSSLPRARTPAPAW
jgi:hypothetical protein